MVKLNLNLFIGNLERKKNCVSQIKHNLSIFLKGYHERDMLFLKRHKTTNIRIGDYFHFKTGDPFIL